MAGNSGMLSFCCLSYNHGRFIRECIESIWNNDYKNIEIIVLDDGSTDNSLEVLNELKAISPCPMIVISQENSGNIGKNFNKSLEMANGEFVSFLACDDKLKENSLKEKMDYMVKDYNIAFICHSKVQAIDEYSKNTNCIQKLRLDDFDNPSVDDLLDLDFYDLGSYYIQGCIYRKDIINAIDGFDEDMICDDIILRTKLHLYIKEHIELTFKVLKNFGVYYRKHSNNISSNSVRQVKSVLQYLERYWPNKQPPDILASWAKYAIFSTDDFLDIFIDNDYKKNFLKTYCISELAPLMLPSYYPYKRFGIPFIFEILSYKLPDYKKKKVFRIFGLNVCIEKRVNKA